jgi:agmatine/peptidylarginine deiminase
MIADNQTEKVYLSSRLELDEEFKPVCKFIIKEFEKIGIEYEFLNLTNDIWVRDYMPIQVSENKFIEFHYDPDYLQTTKKRYRNLKTYPDIVCDKHNIKTIKSGIILDGGNVVKSSDCVILTEKIFIENKYNYTKNQLIDNLQELFETDKIIFIPWFKDVTEEFCGHSDGMVRFIDDNTVLINHIYRNEKSVLNPLLKAGLECKCLNFEVKKEHKDNWAYLNFLQTKNILLITKLGIDEDDQAINQISDCFPEYASKNRIIQVPDMEPIVSKGGALNCISWTIKV